MHPTTESIYDVCAFSRSSYAIVASFSSGQNGDIDADSPWKRRRIQRPERVFRDRSNSFEPYNEAQIKRKFSFPREWILDLAEDPRRDIECIFPRKGFLPAVLQVRFLEDSVRLFRNKHPTWFCSFHTLVVDIISLFANDSLSAPSFCLAAASVIAGWQHSRRREQNASKLDIFCLE